MMDKTTVENIVDSIAEAIISHAGEIPTYMIVENVMNNDLAINSDDVNRLFSDKKSLKRGEWSQDGAIKEYEELGYSIEVGLYYECDHEDYWDGDYTVQVFLGDDVPYCLSVA